MESASQVWNALAEALSDRYALEREVGRGGMATVYLAREAAGGRPVAVKAMHPELASALGQERFRREMTIVGSLSHPGIVPLLDSGRAGTLLYYVMPFVSGESLHERLERERRISPGDAIGIVREIADALGYAHGRGILHRDVKPENVLLATGPTRALIADFGLARAIGAADTTKLTKTGTIVGTIHYMSPEQVREDRTIDERSDVYGLGCVLYEMLTGAPPFVGRTVTDLVMKILRTPPAPISAVNPAVPPAVERAVERALAKPPADRFPTMRELAAALS
ncbi:MAG TPA: serine/threonine-protein kinase [Gemmatimonadales bacterium]|nr:serine/threonine-protein kinase [Gemmatimonadales bacterium]